MPKFSDEFLRSINNSMLTQSVQGVAYKAGAAPGVIRGREEQERRDKGILGGTLAAQQMANEGMFTPKVARDFVGSLQGLGVPPNQILEQTRQLQQLNQSGVLNNNQNQLVGLQQQLNEQAKILLESDDQSRKEAANFYIDSLEEQMVNIAKETRGIDAANLVGIGDKTRAGVTKAQLQQIETRAKIEGAREQMAVSSLERLEFGTEKWEAKAAELEQAGFRRAVQTVRQSQQKIATANKKFEEDMTNFKNPTPAQIKEMKDANITVPDSVEGQRQVWRTYLKSKREKEIEAATAYLDPVAANRAEGLVKWTMQGIAQRGDYIDVFADDITTVIENLTPEQHSEINSLVTGQAEGAVAPIVEKWLRRNYPEPFERSEKFRQNKQRQAAAREKALAEVFAANDDLDPNDPVDVRLVNQKLDAALREGLSGEKDSPFDPSTALF